VREAVGTVGRREGGKEGRREGGTDDNERCGQGGRISRLMTLASMALDTADTLVVAVLTASVVAAAAAVLLAMVRNM